MKKIFEKPHNLLFAASAVILLQFLCGIVCLYTEAVLFGSFSEWVDYVYAAYCLLVCVIAAWLVIKKREIWFSVFALYSFFELIFVISIKYLAYSGDSLFDNTIINLFDKQHLYRLYLCAAVIIIICCVLLFREKKKIYAGFAGANLLVCVLLMIFMPDGEDLLIYSESSIFEVMFVEIIRSAGILLFMLNLFIFAFYRFYHDEE